MTPRLAIAALLLAAACGPQRPQPPAAALEQLDSDGLQRLASTGAVIIDIRRPEEWRRTGVIQGSYLITAFDEDGAPREETTELLRRVSSPEKPVILICQRGNRTTRLAQHLTAQLGYQKVYHLTPGIEDWIALGKSVVPCPSQGPDLHCSAP